MIDYFIAKIKMYTKIIIISFIQEYYFVIFLNLFRFFSL